MTDAKTEGVDWFSLVVRSIPLAVMLGLFLLADIWMATAASPIGDDDGSIVLGITFAQVILLAVWTALAPARLVSRTIVGFSGMVLVALALTACILRSGGGPEPWLFFVIVLVQWVVIQIPFWVFRLIFAWQLCWPSEQVAAPTRQDMQFGIGQLMIWTALVGITLGIGRLLIPDEFDRAGMSPQSLTIFCLLTFYNSLLAWPIVWSMLARRWWPLWIIASVACCVGLTFAEIYTFQSAMGRSGDVEIFWFMNGLQAVAAGVTLLAMRVSGFRLTRHAAQSDQPIGKR